MAQAATLAPSAVAGLLAATPMYRFYWERPTALEGELTFRSAVGTLLEACAARLVRVGEDRLSWLTGEQQEALDDLVLKISELLKHLSRRGPIHLIGNAAETVPRLERQDNALILLLEEAWSLTVALAEAGADSARFDAAAAALVAALARCGEAAEERNRLLGLGWESEFRVRRDLPTR